MATLNKCAINRLHKITVDFRQLHPGNVFGGVSRVVKGLKDNEVNDEFPSKLLKRPYSAYRHGAVCTGRRVGLFGETRVDAGVGIHSVVENNRGVLGICFQLCVVGIVIVAQQLFWGT